MKKGFIGLGAIGRPMAQRLVAAAPGSWVFDISSKAVASLEGDANRATSPAELARHCNAIAICVRDDKDVEALLTGSDGLLDGLSANPGVAIAVHSTIGLDNLQRFAQMAQTVDATLVDAAVTGGAQTAALGELTAMLGGAEDVVERLRPMIGAYASRIIHAGPLGAGMKLKMANNLVTYTQLAVGVESVRLAALCGVDPEQLLEVMRSNGNLTPAMAAYLGSRAKAIAEGGGEEFLATQRYLADLAEKDLDHALAAAMASDVPMLMGAHTRKVFRDIVERTDT